MKVLVCGGRYYKDQQKVNKTLDQVYEKYGDDLIIIHGACKTGADSFAELWAKDREVDYMAFPAKWRKQKRGAGPIRNKRMRDTSRPDACVAFGGGEGTKGMVALMVDYGVTPWVLS